MFALLTLPICADDSKVDRGIAEELGWTYIGSGISREVWALDDDYVLKIGGARECAREIQVWERVKGTDDEKYFAPVLAGSATQGWLIMERCPKVLRDDSLKNRHLMRDIANKLLDIGVGDAHAGNYGFLRNGNLVCLDYAYLASQ